MDRPRLEIHRLYHLDQLYERIRKRKRRGLMASLRGKRRMSQRSPRRMRNPMAELQRHPIPVFEGRHLLFAFERELRFGELSERHRGNRFGRRSGNVFQYRQLLSRMVRGRNERRLQGVRTAFRRIRRKRYLRRRLHRSVGSPPGLVKIQHLLRSGKRIHDD